MKIAIIGAGITGVTTAYYASLAGHSVSVFEQEPHAAMRTSYANGGQVSVSNSEVWTTWANVGKGIQWMFTKDAPLSVRPKLDPAQWSWLAKFLYNTATGVYEQNTERTIRMGLQSRPLYDAICAQERINFDRSDCGILHFYKDPDYFEHARDVKQLYNDNGVEWDIVTPETVVDIDPALRSIDGIIGGAWTPSDWTGDIHKFCYQLSNILSHKYSVKFYYNNTADIDYLLSQHDVVIVCAGVGSVEVAKEIGDSLPIYPVKGYSITINNVNPVYLPRVSLLDDRAKIVTSTLGNRLRVAGTAELDGENYDIRYDRIQPLLDWVHTNFPCIDTHDYSSWACLRPMTPDMMPIVRVSERDHRIYYNTGHGHLGWTLAPYTAKKIIDNLEETQ